MPSKEPLVLTAPLYEYLLDHSLRESDLLRELRQETAKLEMGVMQIAPEQGQFLQLLVKLCGAKRAIEVGVFTGYSSLCIAEAMGEGSRLLACDVDEGWTSIAQTFWRRAMVESRIALKLAPAVKTLEAEIQAGHVGSYDFAFIDADKENYQRYYELCLELVKPGGLLVLDNVLWGGSVADPKNSEASTKAIREVTRYIHSDQRVDTSLIPVADGLLLARKR